MENNPNDKIPSSAGPVVGDRSRRWPYVVAVVAVFGTTISPYLFFWQASQEVEEQRAAKGEEPLKRAPEQARMQLRRRPHHMQISLDEPMCENELSLSERLADVRRNPEDEYQEAELKARLRESASQLSPTLRTTFQLRELQELSVRETAGVLNLTEGTVKAHLHRARAKLTRSMRCALDPRRPPAPRS